MKKISVIAMTAIFVAAMISSVFAAGSLTPSQIINGSVTGVCTQVTAPGTLSIAIDPSTAGPFNSSYSSGGDMQIKCTKNHPYTVGCTSTNSWNLSNGSFSIPYGFTCPGGGSGNGFGGAGTITLSTSASVTTGYTDAPVGAYSDTVTITVGY